MYFKAKGRLQKKESHLFTKPPFLTHTYRYRATTKERKVVVRKRGWSL